MRRRTIYAALISVIPNNALRVYAYSKFKGYQLDRSSKIGLLSVIDVEEFVCGPNSTIGPYNSFIGPIRVSIGTRTLIARGNRFECSWHASAASREFMRYARRLLIGDDVLIHVNHFFDVHGELRIGNRTWFAGRGSEVWTHGASVQDRDVTIGEDCYIGSSVKFAPGACLLDKIVVGLGSVVVGKNKSSNAIMAGTPAKYIRDVAEGEFSFEPWW